MPIRGQPNWRGKGQGGRPPFEGRYDRPGFFAASHERRDIPRMEMIQKRGVDEIDRERQRRQRVRQQ